MIVAGHQPEFLPYMGFFSKISKADVFVIADNIQYRKKYFQNRNKIKTRDGWMWLTVPVITKGKFEQKINEVNINNSVNWRRRIWASISSNYKNAPYFRDYEELFKDVFSRDWDMLVELNETLLRCILKQLGIKVKTLRGSELGVSGKKTDLLIDICKKTGADTYLSGSGGKNYVDESKLKAHNLNHKFHEFQHPVYPQQFGEFLPYMSIIDLLFNVGEKAREYI